MGSSCSAAQEGGVPGSGQPLGCAQPTLTSPTAAACSGSQGSGLALCRLFWLLILKKGASEILFVPKERPCVQLKLVSGKPHSRKDELLTKGF